MYYFDLLYVILFIHYLGFHHLIEGGIVSMHCECEAPYFIEGDRKGAQPPTPSFNRGGDRKGAKPPTPSFNRGGS